MNFSSNANCQDWRNLPARAIAQPLVAPQVTALPVRCVVAFVGDVALSFLAKNPSSMTATEPTTKIPMVAIEIPSHSRRSRRVRKTMRVVIADKTRIEQLTTPMIDAGHNIIDTKSQTLTHISLSARGTMTQRLRHELGGDPVRISMSADRDTRGCCCL